MKKHFILTSLSVFALLLSSSLRAEENMPSQMSDMVEAPAEASVQTEAIKPEPLAPPVPMSVKSQRPMDENHVDYRHCLDLPTNPEIAACVYKNRK